MSCDCMPYTFIGACMSEQVHAHTLPVVLRRVAHEAHHQPKRAVNTLSAKLHPITARAIVSGPYLHHYDGHAGGKEVVKVGMARADGPTGQRPSVNVSGDINLVIHSGPGDQGAHLEHSGEAVIAGDNLCEVLVADEKGTRDALAGPRTQCK